MTIVVALMGGDTTGLLWKLHGRSVDPALRAVHTRHLLTSPR